MSMSRRTSGPASQEIVGATGMINVRVSPNPVALTGMRRASIALGTSSRIGGFEKAFSTASETSASAVAPRE